MAYPEAEPGASPDIEAVFGEAIACHRAGRLGEAEQLYQRVLQVEPQQFDCLHLLGVIAYQRGEYARAVHQIEFALTLRSDVADAHNNLGNALKKLRRFDDALASYNKAIALEPDDAASLNNRGSVLRDLKRYAEARADFDRAIALKAEFVEALNNRGNVLRKLDRPDEALKDYDRARVLKPADADISFNRGKVLHDLGRIEEALAEFDHAVSLKPDSADALWNRALCRLLLGRYREGWADYEWRWHVENIGRHRRAFRQPQWAGKADLSGKTILLHSEQGLGDTIMAARYVPRVAATGARVILDVQSPLVPLLARVAGVAEVVSDGDTPSHFDFHCPLMSLPALCATTLDTIPAEVPYLSVPPAYAEKWAPRLPRWTAPRVGISWAGSAVNEEDRQRSIPLPSMLPLLSRSDVHYVSIQKDLRDGDAEILRANPRIMHLGGAIDSFADTAAIVACLDLVISVDASVVHLAGALGKPVWILLPCVPDWRWLLDRTDSPWYPTARLFRQSERNNWAPRIADVGRALSAFVADKSAA